MVSVLKSQQLSDDGYSSKYKTEHNIIKHYPSQLMTKDCLIVKISNLMVGDSAESSVIK